MPPRSPQAICHDLVRRSIDLQRLYRHAAAACEPGLRMVLGENAHTLGVLIADLQRANDSMLQQRGSWRGTVHRHVAGCLVRTAARRDHAWIRVLAHHESALLQAFERAIAVVPAESARVLHRQLPRLRGIHLDMHNLVGSARY
ncbi:hypothetical protein B0E46_04445 [Rhodanobacter sp. B04]|uniref:hypothetical protein n=1 Tax=Rhodanobacter sp. B04 TaxID=1945860 RepID=UPI000985E327|nr:hypothetical protein [Rhodanobacter sp. B04]OOG65674.1 hypothetical protein B0E46_04445 [Rhodanobacter sp. B04]